MTKNSGYNGCPHTSACNDPYGKWFADHAQGGAGWLGRGVSPISGACWNFNRGTCMRQFCRYKHECSQCGGKHANSQCFTTRREGWGDSPGDGGQVSSLFQRGHTPVNLDMLVPWLGSYPDFETAAKLYWGFKDGFRIGYQGPRYHRWADNFKSAKELSQIVSIDRSLFLPYSFLLQTQILTSTCCGKVVFLLKPKQTFLCSS